MDFDPIPGGMPSRITTRLLRADFALRKRLEFDGPLLVQFVSGRT